MDATADCHPELNPEIFSLSLSLSLRQHGVSYFNPQLPHWDVRMVPIEREAKERSCVLLYVVCGDTLSVASMVEVSYYLGQGRTMVLCISDIPVTEDSVEIEGMKVRRVKASVFLSLKVLLLSNNYSVDYELFAFWFHVELLLVELRCKKVVLKSVGL